MSDTDTAVMDPTTETVGDPIIIESTPIGGNGGDPHAPAVSDQQPQFKGLLDQIDELKRELKDRDDRDRLRAEADRIKDQKDRRARELVDARDAKKQDLAAKMIDKEQIGKAIKGLEEGISSLSDEIASLLKGHFQPGLPFEQKEEVAQPSSSNQENGPTSDDWRKVLLVDVFADAYDADIKLPKTVVEKLKDNHVKGRNDAANLLTIGDLSDFLKNPHSKLTDIEGIGPGTAEKIERALELWWEKHPQGEVAQPAADSRMKIVTLEELGVAGEDVPSWCERELLTTAPYRGGGHEIPSIKDALIYNGQPYVVTPTLAENSYILRPLIEAQQREPTPDDDYFGRQVNLCGQIVEIGPLADCLMLNLDEPQNKDEEPPQEPEAEAPDGLGEDVIVPLNEVMPRKVGKNRKGKRRNKK